MCEKLKNMESNINCGCEYIQVKRGNKIIKLEKENLLAIKRPDLLDEWDYEKNNKLGITPYNVSCGSHMKVWWKCKKNDKHPSYDMALAHKTDNKGCPYCVGKKVCEENCLATANPTLIEQWLTEKNEGLTPYDVTPNSNKAVWWRCERGHEWKAVINSRNRGCGCKECNNYFQTSYPQLFIYFYLKKYFPCAVNKYILENTRNMEADIYISSINLAIEYDGVYFHSDEESIERDNRKDDILVKDNTFIRVREKGLPPVQNKDVLLIKRKNKSEKSLQEVLKELFDIITNLPNVEDELKKELIEEKFDFNESRIEIYSMIEQIEKENSIEAKMPHLLEQWDYERNKNIKPSHVACGSNLKFWWKCTENKNHPSYEMVVTNKTGSKKAGCPYCTGRRVCDDNCLATIHPELVKEWDYEKNGDLTPKDVTPGSSKEVYWVCNKDNTHPSYKMIISNKTRGQKCPYCAGKRAWKDDNLAVNNPELLKEWNYEKNTNVDPHKLKSGSNKIVWWTCPDCGEDYTAYINDRTSDRKSGCPYCAGKKVSKHNCLATKRPDLSKEWHKSKNGGLTPNDVLPGSNKSVWWTCHICGTDFQDIINSRNRFTPKVRKCCRNKIKEKS